MLDLDRRSFYGDGEIIILIFSLYLIYMETEGIARFGSRQLYLFLFIPAGEGKHFPHIFGFHHATELYFSADTYLVGLRRSDGNRFELRRELPLLHLEREGEFFQLLIDFGKIAQLEISFISHSRLQFSFVRCKFNRVAIYPIGFPLYGGREMERVLLQFAVHFHSREIHGKANPYR